jgi:hypothetical protein
MSQITRSKSFSLETTARASAAVAAMLTAVSFIDQESPKGITDGLVSVHNKNSRLFGHRHPASRSKHGIKPGKKNK